MNRANVLVPIFALGALVLSFQACSKASFGVDNGTFSSLSSKYGGPAICDPLSGAAGGAVVSAKNGLVGKLIYETSANQTALGTPNTFAELVARGTVAPATLFMNAMNVANRAFTEGFSADGAAALTDASTGEKLVEWFGIDMNSVIKLAAGDSPGYYQFATISDDGSLLDATVNGQTVALVGNDNLHGMTAKCSSTAVYLDASAAMPLRYRYFQGPRTAIGSIIAWRKVSGAAPAVSDCDQSQTNANGWAPIPAKNYFLPSDAPANPCN